jgi:hypothetical protein
MSSGVQFPAKQHRGSRVSEVEQIESRIKNLSREDLAKLRMWFAEFDTQAWDKQIEADTAAGKLNRLIEESMAEHGAGQTKLIEA